MKAYGVVLAAKNLFLLSAAVCFLLASCGAGDAPGKDAADELLAAVSSATKKGPTARELLRRYMPEQMADGAVKVAIVRNLTVSDHTRQFLEGCVSEGRAMGFTVDTFITDGNDKRCRDLIARIAEADYDGLIFSHGDADFSYTSLKPAFDKGLKMVTFDALPFENGDPAAGIMAGVTSTAQDDIRLAEMSLSVLFSRFDAPVRVIRVWSGPGLPPMDRRQTVYDRFVREGKIKELARIGPRRFAFSRDGTREALSAILSRFPPGTVDAIWAPYDEFAKGCIDALQDAGRDDIKLVSIDISNDDIRLMREHSSVWLGTAATDPKLIGIVNMRLLAAKFCGETTPDTYNFDVQFVPTGVLTPNTNMVNIAFTVPGWGQERGLFDNYPWMAELKAAEKKYLRLRPLMSGGSR